MPSWAKPWRSVSRIRLDSGMVAEWCLEHLGAQPVRTIFEAGYLSLVHGLELTDGRQVVLKARQAAPRLEVCCVVQRHLFQSGFPCPEPLAGPAPLGDLAASAEAYVPGGEQLEPGPESPQRFAFELARLIRLAPPADDRHLRSLPWVAWDHDLEGTWPEPDDSHADLNAVLGPSWLEELGRRVKRRLQSARALPRVVGHADWESQNLRWLGSELHVVHDWDSLVSQPEATLAGAASAVYTATGAPNTSASTSQAEAFLDAYERARATAWPADERQLAWAAGLWVRAFNAKKSTLRAQPSESVKALQDEADERLARAGA
jgi:hypothetical protein